MLEKGIGSIWIEGEISNLAQPASGHWYFSLKDEQAQLRAAMFKNRNNRVGFTPRNGQQVLVRAMVTIYEARGDFQVIVEHMEEAGIGLLMRQYEALKKKLSAEGLFLPNHKKPVPSKARHIGLITSASGAAVRDAISVIRRRSPSSQVTLFPTQVQGEQASGQIVRAIQQANQFGQCDVLLLIRGGGSLEDLWCFNEEPVARAIFASDCPVVSGVGHEIDFTIADLVADLRAPTPSVAAENVTMDQYEIMSQIDLLQSRLLRGFQQYRQTRHERSMALLQRLSAFHPQQQMSALKQRLSYVLSRLSSTQSIQLKQFQGRLMLILQRLQGSNPINNIPALTRLLATMHHQLVLGMNHQLQQQKHQLRLQARSLDNLSPLKTLSRGYAAISKGDMIISSATQLKRDDEIDIRFSDGKRSARVE